MYIGNAINSWCNAIKKYDKKKQSKKFNKPINTAINKTIGNKRWFLNSRWLKAFLLFRLYILLARSSVLFDRNFDAKRE